MLTRTVLVLVLLSTADIRDASAQQVPPVDFSTIAPSDFADDELDLVYHLAHFHTLANSVRMSEPNRGFIDLAVWRAPRHQEPYNARVMENILSLAYFYVTDRPWNPYHGHPSVRARLEAALEFWIEIQSEDGQFSAYGPEEWLLSPTAFASKYFGETIRLLHGGPPIDAGLFDRVVAAQRRAILAVLSSESYYRFGQRFANQYTGVWGGALAYLELFPDVEVRELLETRLLQSDDDFQSPAGFFYEHDGPDWVYDVETHHSNHLMAWHFLRSTDLGAFYARRIQRWYDWLSYNAVREPDDSGYTVNYAVATRRRLPFYVNNRQTDHGVTCSPLAEDVTIARAFCESLEERQGRLDARRRHLEQNWPPDIAPLEIGRFAAYSPLALLHQNHVTWHPTTQQRAETFRLLPYEADEYFTHQRSDTRKAFVSTFIRRPTYYAVFTSGRQLTSQQRFGLGLIWTPQAGTVLQGQMEGPLWDASPESASETGMAWGTRTSAQADVYETEVLDAVITVDGRSISTSERPTNLNAGPLSVIYALGSQGRKMVTFEGNGVRVEVQHEGDFVETIPLLLGPRDRIEVVDSVALVSSGEVEVRIVIDENSSSRLIATDRRIGAKRVHVLQLRDSETLTYRLQFE